MKLSNLEKIKGNKKKAIRVGRGIGSGKGGHTTGKGTKGQKARVGNSIPFGFEGGQVPIFKKLPKIGGFRSLNRKDIVAIPLSSLNIFEEGSEVSPATLVEANIIKKLPRHGIKLLATGKLEKKLKLVNFIASAGAISVIEASGSTLTADVA